jgi:hypothetical protein
MKVAALLLLLCVVGTLAVPDRYPTVREYKETHAALKEMTVDMEALPHGTFSLERCPQFSCRTWSLHRDTLECTYDQSLTAYAILLIESDGTLRLKKNGMTSGRMDTFLYCLSSDLLILQHKEEAEQKSADGQQDERDSPADGGGETRAHSNMDGSEGQTGSVAATQRQDDQGNSDELTETHD